MKRLLITFALCLTFSLTALAQRAGLDWMTDNADAQRSAWIRNDNKINKDSMTKPGFQFLWKYKTKNLAKGLNSLQPPATLDRLIGYRGFRMLGFFAGSDNNLVTIDTDLGRLEWEKKLNVAASSFPGTLTCPGGITTGVARPVLVTIPPAPTGAAGMGRNTPAKSAVGEAGQGAVTLANVRPNPPRAQQPPPPANPMLQQPGRVNAANPPGGQLGAGPFLVYALAGDGKLHALHLSNGQDYKPPVPFLPPGANAAGLIVLDAVAYAVTTNGCNNTANGVWRIDTLTNEVKSWKGNVVGTTAFDGEGMLYVTTGSGGDKPNALVALDPNTLTEKASFKAPAEFVTPPVIFAHGGKTLIAAVTKDGSIHLFDSANLSAPLNSSAALLKGTSALASWQDRDGTRWLLAPHEGALPAGFASTGVTKGAVLAFKLGTDNKLTPGWASRNLTAPLTPTIINGVVFATSSGEAKNANPKLTAARSEGAVLYALDGATGKELWSSGTTIRSFARGNALAGSMSQIYLTTYDGTIYTFGYPMEH